jgi:hypothetical protein
MQRGTPRAAASSAEERRSSTSSDTRIDPAATALLPFAQVLVPMRAGPSVLRIPSAHASGEPMRSGLQTRGDAWGSTLRGKAKQAPLVPRVARPRLQPDPRRGWLAFHRCLRRDERTLERTRLHRGRGLLLQASEGRCRALSALRRDAQRARIPAVPGGDRRAHRRRSGAPGARARRWQYAGRAPGSRGKRQPRRRRRVEGTAVSPRWAGSGRWRPRRRSGLLPIRRSGAWLAFLHKSPLVPSPRTCAPCWTPSRDGRLASLGVGRLGPGLPSYEFRLRFVETCAYPQGFSRILIWPSGHTRGGWLEKERPR